MKKIKENLKRWLTKKLYKQLKHYIILDLTNKEYEFLCEDFLTKRSNIGKV